MKTVNAVIRLRRDSEVDFEKVKDTFVPANGEMILVDTTNDGLRVKIGDGVSTFAELDYTNLGAADIKASDSIDIASDGTISIADEYTNNVLSSASSAADRAGQSAITAGNFAAQAIQAQQAIDKKIWYGTMAQYNALETVSNSTIYIILHE